MAFLSWGCNRGDPSGGAGSGPGPNAAEPVTELKLSEPFEPAPPISIAADDWPWWRGPRRDAIGVGGAPPMEWQEGKNVLWKTPLDGQGNSSPIVVRSRLYLTTYRASPRPTQCVEAFDADTGQSAWSTTVHADGFTEKLHPKATYADPTLACDGERLFAAFLHEASVVVTALNLDGEIVWQTRVGSYHTHSYGYGASPVLFESFVIVAVDDPDGGSISALHRQTGKVLWRIRRPEGESYATPVIAEVDGRPQLLINGKKIIASYDPATGELLWSEKSAALVACNSMEFDGSLVFASGGMPDKETVCLRAAVDAEESRVLWRDTHSAATCYVPSLLLYDGRLFNLNDDGVLTGFDSQDGKQLFKRRFKGKFTASPVIAAGNLILVNEDGTAWVLRASPPFAPVSRNELEDGIMATPTLVRGRIYLRSSHHLYCIGFRD